MHGKPKGPIEVTGVGIKIETLGKGAGAGGRYMRKNDRKLDVRDGERMVVALKCTKGRKWLRTNGKGVCDAARGKDRRRKACRDAKLARTVWGERRGDVMDARRVISKVKSVSKGCEDVYERRAYK